RTCGQQADPSEHSAPADQRRRPVGEIHTPAQPVPDQAEIPPLLDGLRERGFVRRAPSTPLPDGLGVAGPRLPRDEPRNEAMSFLLQRPDVSIPIAHCNSSPPGSASPTPPPSADVSLEDVSEGPDANNFRRRIRAAQ